MTPLANWLRGLKMRLYSSNVAHFYLRMDGEANPQNQIDPFS